ncbi:hypothetical protein Tco_1498578 [Tanacetum coccineum]
MILTYTSTQISHLSQIESESLDLWLWFLSALGDDLDLHINSNFTFITDRQKGLLPAIKRLFPSAEHRKWEVSGLPYKHATTNLEGPNPIAGRHYWENIEWPSILIPLKPHPHIGRPPKKKKKSVVELDDLFGGVKLSKKGSTVTCTNCKEKRHNKRGCKKTGGGRAVGVAASGTATQQEPVASQQEVVASG